MMTSLLVFFSLLMGTIAQAMFGALTYLGDAKPPILLGVVVYFALSKQLQPAMITAALAGFLHDAMTPGMIKVGTTAVVFMAMAWVINESKDHLFGQRLGTQVLVGAAGAIAMTIFIYVALMMSGGFYLSFTGLLAKVWGTVLLATLVVPLVCQCISWMDHSLGLAEVES